jgi:hypothetical protein
MRRLLSHSAPRVKTVPPKVQFHRPLPKHHHVNAPVLVERNQVAPVDVNSLLEMKTALNFSRIKSASWDKRTCAYKRNLMEWTKTFGIADIRLEALACALDHSSNLFNDNNAADTPVKHDSSTVDFVRLLISANMEIEPMVVFSLREEFLMELCKRIVLWECGLLL